MADEVASLGFAVDSSQLDAAKQKLSDLGTQAGKTGASVDSFNQSVSKTASAGSSAGGSIGTITPALSAIEAAARRAGVSVAEMQARTAAFTAGTAALASSSGAAGTAIGAIANATGAAAPGLTALGATSKAAAAEQKALNGEARNLAIGLRSLTPFLEALGVKMGDLRGFSSAAREGLQGLAIIAGGAALVALAKLGDEVDQSKARFAGLTGSAQAGAAAYDAVKAAAQSSGVQFDSLASAVEKAQIGQDTFASKTVTYANTAENAAKATAGLASAFGTFGSIMQANLATADQEKKALDTLGTSFQTTGTLGVKAFQAIQAESPGTARAIANAFGYQKVTDFITQLAKTPISIDDFVKRMALVAPAVATGFDPERPKTFGQALTEVESAGKDLLETLAKLGAGDALKQFLVDLQHPLQTVQQNTDDVDQAFITMLVTLGQLPTTGLSALTSWANGAIAEISKVVSAAVSGAQTAAAALAKIAGAAPGAIGSAISAAGGAGGTEGIQLGPSSDSSGGSFSGGSDAAVISTSDTSSFDYASAVGDGTYPAFADGGQLTVTGSGGTDSQLVQFNATPGEIVTVTTPGQAAVASPSSPSGGIEGLTTIQNQPVAGAISATPDAASQATVQQITDAISQSTIDITKQIDTGNNNIVDALNKLTTGVGASTINPATGLPIAGTSASTVTSAATGPLFNVSQFGTPASGGGFSTQGSISPTQDATDKAHAAAQSAAGIPLGSYLSNFGYNQSVTRGQAAPIRRTMTSQFPSGGALNPLTGLPLASTVPVNPNYSPGINGLPGYPYDYSAGNNDFTGGEFPAGYEVGGPNDYSDVFNYSAGNNDFTGGQFPSDASSIFDSAVYDLSGAGDVSDGSGGGDFSMGYATGGSFIVGGDGGTDTTPVGFMGTRGERVTVTPANVANPVGASISPDPAASIQQSNSQGPTTKIVNMYLHSSVQANDILRSRSQIVRGFT